MVDIRRYKQLVIKETQPIMPWIPASAGMTMEFKYVIPAKVSVDPDPVPMHWPKKKRNL